MKCFYPSCILRMTLSSHLTLSMPMSLLRHGRIKDIRRVLCATAWALIIIPIVLISASCIIPAKTVELTILFLRLLTINIYSLGRRSLSGNTPTLFCFPQLQADSPPNTKAYLQKMPLLLTAPTVAHMIELMTSMKKQSRS